MISCPDFPLDEIPAECRDTQAEAWGGGQLWGHFNCLPHTSQVTGPAKAHYTRAFVYQSRHPAWGWRHGIQPRILVVPHFLSFQGFCFFLKLKKQKLTYTPDLLRIFLNLFHHRAYPGSGNSTDNHSFIYSFIILYTHKHLCTGLNAQTVLELKKQRGNILSLYSSSFSPGEWRQACK